ncbi:hypothetical protein, partial [Mycobacterium pseudoshottsii]|uniref:hypothetical protein n=1 Tax=Mycobacterium pseudoshottsii TaxID=265949 RepID=UPI001F35967E
FDRQPPPRPPQSTIPQLTSLLINNAGALARCGPAILLESDSMAPCAESADPAAPPDSAEVCKH